MAIKTQSPGLMDEADSKDQSTDILKALPYYIALQSGSRNRRGRILMLLQSSHTRGNQLASNHAARCWLTQATTHVADRFPMPVKRIKHNRALCSNLYFARSEIMFSTVADREKKSERAQTALIIDFGGL